MERQEPDQEVESTAVVEAEQPQMPQEVPEEGQTAVALPQAGELQEEAQLLPHHPHDASDHQEQAQLRLLQDPQEAEQPAVAEERIAAEEVQTAEAELGIAASELHQQRQGRLEAEELSTEAQGAAFAFHSARHLAAVELRLRGHQG